MAEAGYATPAQAQYLLGCVGDMSSWVHRRVEMITFRDADWVTRKVSVDFTLPAGAPPLWMTTDETCHLVPLIFLQRGFILRNFDCRDEEGNALPVLTTAEQVEFERALLVQLADYIFGTAGRKFDMSTVEAVDAVMKGVESHGLWPGSSHAGPSGDAPQFLMDQKAFTFLRDRLKRDFLLMTQLSGAVERRRVVKMCYDQASPPRRADESDENRVLRLIRRAGWKGQLYEFPSDVAGDTQSYHFGVIEPPELRVRKVDFVPSLELAELPKVRSETDRIVVSGMKPNTPSAVYVELAAKRDGWLRNAMLSAWMTVAVLFTGAVGFILKEPTETDSAAAVMVWFLGLLPVVVARAGEHPLASALLSGVRVLLGACAVLAVAGAARLAFFDTDGVGWFWLALAALGALMAGALTTSYIRAGQGETA